MSDDTLPPVGATVTDTDGLALRIGSAAADWNLYLNSSRGYDPAAPIKSVTDALETAAVVFRALMHERDQLKAEREEDAARLDWLDAEALRRRDDETQESYYDLSRVHLTANSFGVWVAGTLRTAIDAARAAQGGA